MRPLLNVGKNDYTVCGCIAAGMAKNIFKTSYLQTAFSLLYFSFLVMKPRS